MVIENATDSAVTATFDFAQLLILKKYMDATLDADVVVKLHTMFINQGVTAFSQEDVYVQLGQIRSVLKIVMEAFEPPKPQFIPVSVPGGVN